MKKIAENTFTKAYEYVLKWCYWLPNHVFFTWKKIYSFMTNDNTKFDLLFEVVKEPILMCF